MKKDYDKAKYLYEKGLPIAKDETDITVLHERLEDLRHICPVTTNSKDYCEERQVGCIE